MMLPPFVPPSARGNREALPSITEFVSNGQERSFANSADTSGTPIESPSLPVITDFILDQPAAHARQEARGVEQPSVRQESRGAESGWLEEERNAFDWQSVSMLAIRQNEERRADEEWTATSWDKSTESTLDHIAAMLMQVARRVRGGELRVEGSPEMSVEAALAATLSALLQTGSR